MTVQTGPANQQQSAPPPGVWMPEDEIDLREYILVLVAWWREILLFALVAAILGAGGVVALRLLQEPMYEASALVAISRVRSDVNFEERFVTETGEELTATNTAARRLALVGLVNSSAVAEAVIAEVGTLLEEDERDPAALLDMVSGEIATVGDQRGATDLIEITARAQSPQKAATIANTWAQTYVENTNRLYGDVPNELLSSVQVELTNAQTAYEEAQLQLETFVSSSEIDRLQRLIGQKQQTIASLQESRQEAMRQFVSTYNDVLIRNRLLAFTAEQDAKRKLLSSYIDAEVENRISAFENDRAARRILYDRLVQTELDSLTAVLDEQVTTALSNLSRAYAEERRLQAFLVDAQGLRLQIAEGGDGAAETNALPLALLKAQIFTASGTLPSGLILDLSPIPGQSLTAAEQQADVTALIAVLTDRLARLDEEIETQSQALATGEVYEFLDVLDPDLLAASRTVETEDAGDAAASDLQQAIEQRYQDLYDVGTVASTSQTTAQDSALFASIEELYAQLFSSDALAQLGDSIQTEELLALLDEEQLQRQLLMAPNGNLVVGAQADGPLVRAVQQLELEIQSLEGQLESESARRQRLVEARDLARQTLNTLQNKVAELRLSSTTANSEVRFAVPAVPPVQPIRGPSLLTTTALAGIVGLMLAVFIAFLANFLGTAPFFKARPVEATQ